MKNHGLSTFLAVCLLAFLCLAGEERLLAVELSVYPALPDNQYRSDLYEVTVRRAAVKDGG